MEPILKQSDLRIVEWVLRIAVFGEFLGHGVLALQVTPKFVGLIEGMSGITGQAAEYLLVSIGIIDIITAVLAIVFPFRLLLLWASVWGFLTALARPVAGEPVWDFVERWANWGAPLALLYLRRFPTTFKELFTT